MVHSCLLEPAGGAQQEARTDLKETGVNVVVSPEKNVSLTAAVVYQIKGQNIPKSWIESRTCT